MERELLTDEALESSAIVANCRMNRQREIVGKNSYTADLFLNPLEFLGKRMENHQSVAWLDRCCGTGKVLIQAASNFHEHNRTDQMAFYGVDLVDMFDPQPQEYRHLTLEAASVREWRASAEYDLITCVHGLHYVGNKLGLIARAVSWLKPDGLFVAHLDFHNLKLTSGQWFGDHKRPRGVRTTTRGDKKPSDSVREAIRARIDDAGFSEMDSPGRPWSGKS